MIKNTFFIFLHISCANVIFIFTNMVEEEKKNQRILVVTGTRDDKVDQNYIIATLDKYLKWADQVFIGNANGVDKCAKEYCMKQQVDVRIFQAQWHTYGNAAGPIRNKYMINEAIKASNNNLDNVIVCAFPKKKLEESKGTRGCMKLATEKNVRVDVFEI